jgi:hypothetical protein
MSLSISHPHTSTSLTHVFASKHCTLPCFCWSIMMQRFFFFFRSLFSLIFVLQLSLTRKESLFLFLAAAALSISLPLLLSRCNLISLLLLRRKALFSHTQKKRVFVTEILVANRTNIPQTFLTLKQPNFNIFPPPHLPLPLQFQSLFILNLSLIQFILSTHLFAKLPFFSIQIPLFLLTFRCFAPTAERLRCGCSGPAMTSRCAAWPSTATRIASSPTAPRPTKPMRSQGQVKMFSFILIHIFGAFFFLSFFFFFFFVPFLFPLIYCTY